EVAAGFRVAEFFYAQGRIMHHDASGRGMFQDYEVVHVPVQNAWSLEISEAFKLYPQWTSLQFKAGGKADDMGQRCGSQGNGETSAQRRQVNAVAMIVGHHGQAGQPAFRCLRLKDDRQPASK